MGTNEETKTLLNDRHSQSRKKDLCKKLVFVIILLVFLIATAIILIPVAEKMYKFCGSEHSLSAIHKYTRSGSVSLLSKTNADDLTCVKPIINAQLKGEASVIVYEIFCRDLRTKAFPAGRKSLTYENVVRPIVVLSEDFGENYFLKGTIDVAVNATFNTSLPATDIYVCLFVDYEIFMDFTNSDKDWRMYVNNATCRHSSEGQLKANFNVTDPNYVFVALAMTNALSTLQFGYNGTRYDYDIPTFRNMTNLCTLRSDKPESSVCSFSIGDTGDDLCLLASNGINADSSYYYSTIILTFPYIKQHTAVGALLTVLAVFFLVMGIIVFTIILALLLRKS